MKTFKEGQEIIFTEDCIEDATGDHPILLLAKKGETGKIISKSNWIKDGWFVQPDSHNHSFHAKGSEFKLKS
jgi:hypothetical protein